MDNVHKHIEHSILRHKKGAIIFPTDFRGKGSDTAIKMSLSRLCKEDKLKRLAKGIYYIPKVDPLFGTLLPVPEEVAEAVAKKEKVEIKPAGANALHRLGLTTQVPTKLVYITNGEDRQIKMGKTTIRFKATTPKKMAMEGELSSLIIQALSELKTKNIDSYTENKLKTLLEKETPNRLKKNLSIAPANIHNYILKLLNKPK